VAVATVSAPGTGARSYRGAIPRPPWGFVVGVVIVVGVLLGLATGKPAQAQAPACEDRSARALETIAEQSRRQTAALERIAERLR